MPESSPVGSHIVAVHHSNVFWAAQELASTFDGDDLRKLKVRAGEHLAAILATAYLGCAPIAIDRAGEADLVFDLSRSTSVPQTMGLADTRFADFEIKSLKGPYREFDASIDREALEGRVPRERVYCSTFRAANDVLALEGMEAIEAAARQLKRKSGDDHSKNVFVISHFLDHPVAEVTDAPLLAHHLAPLVDVVGVDTVWVLWAPHSLTMWSVRNAGWVNMLFSATNEGLSESTLDDGLEVLEQVEVEFLRQAEGGMSSPYLFRLNFDSNDDHDPA